MASKISNYGYQQPTTSLQKQFEAFVRMFQGRQVAYSQLTQAETDFVAMVVKGQAGRLNPADETKASEVLRRFAKELKQWQGIDIFSSAPVPTSGNSAKRTIAYRSKRFIFQFSYDPSLVASIKAIPGSKFDANSKTWSTGHVNAQLVSLFAKQHGFYLQADAQIALEGLESNIDQSYSNEYIELNLPLNATLYPFQTQGIDFAMKNKKVINGDQMGLGKAQPLTAKVLTPEGYIQMGDIKVGQKIINSNGGISQVTGVYPQGKKDVYKVIFSDRAETECCGEHLWQVHSASAKYSGTRSYVKELSEFKDSLYHKNGNRKWYVPIAKPAQFTEKELPLNPYLLGVLLGDGCLRHRVLFSTADAEIVESIRSLMPEGMHITKSNKYDHCIYEKKGTQRNRVKEILKKLGLWGKLSNAKFIPEIYLHGSIEQRIAMMQGLLDTDGYVNKKGDTVQFTSVSSQLIEGLKFIIQSLGGLAPVSVKYPKGCQKAYTITCKLPALLIPFRLTRRLARLTPKTKYPPCRGIKTVEYIGKKECQCISVDAPDSLYITDNFILTHNTIQGIGSVIGLDAFPCLVICPKSLKLNWVNEFQKFTDKRAIMLDKKNYDSFSYYNKLGYYQVGVVNYESVESLLLTTKKTVKDGRTINEVVQNAICQGFKSVIIDEAHELRNMKTNRFKSVEVAVKGKDYRMLLTGTPIVNEPTDIAALLVLLGRISEFGGIRAFKSEYKGLTKEFIDSKDNVSKGNQDKLKYLNIKLRNTCFIRREKHKVLTQLPAKVRQVMKVEITTQSEYDLAFRSLQKFLLESGKSDAEIAKSLQAEVLVKMGALRQISARGKMQALRELVNEVIGLGEKLVIFVWHNEIYQLIKSEYPDAVSITGNDSDLEVEVNKKAFQENPDTNLIIVSYKRGGVGHTLTAASKVAFMELGWNPKDQNQAEDRAHRIGQENHVNCYYLLGNETIDEWVYDIIQAKDAAGKLAVGSTEDITVETTSNLQLLIEKVKAKK